jgi:uncharacterized protein YbaR (Trm112 family)
MSFVPYVPGELMVDEQGRLFEILVCPACGQEIKCRDRKDFESFSHIEFAEHYVKHEVKE